MFSSDLWLDSNWYNVTLYACCCIWVFEIRQPIWNCQWIGLSRFLEHLGFFQVCHHQLLITYGCIWTVKLNFMLFVDRHMHVNWLIVSRIFLFITLRRLDWSGGIACSFLHRSCFLFWLIYFLDLVGCLVIIEFRFTETQVWFVLQVLTKEDVETLNLCKRMINRGEWPPLMVVFDPEEGYVYIVSKPFQNWLICSHCG